MNFSWGIYLDLASILLIRFALLAPAKAPVLPTTQFFLLATALKTE